MKLQFSLATLYEWAAIITGLCAAACVAYGGLSIVTRAVDFKLPFGLDNVTLSEGAIRFRHISESAADRELDVIEMDEKSLPLPVWQVPPRRILLPGFQYREIITSGGLTKAWAVWISMLIPIILLSAISSICFWQYLRIRRLKSSRENGPPVG
jgi:hypothetical protein